MIASKEQEVHALAKIKQIIEELGENSYVAAAFEGCFEIAEENIRNDWGCSLKQELEQAKKEAKDFRKSSAEFSARCNELKAENQSLQKKILSQDALKICMEAISVCINMFDDSRKEAATEIVRTAEAPNLPDFQKAVRLHRDSEEKYNRYVELNQKIKKVFFT